MFSTTGYHSIFRLCPPLQEQLSIVQHIVNQISPLRLAVSNADHEIDLLREYRTRLIADIVTGKLDVRGIELPSKVDQAEELEDWGEFDLLDTKEMMDMEEVADEAD